MWVQTLVNCRRALQAHGRILLIERIVPDKLKELALTRGPILSEITMTDLNMMVMTSGRERTIAEYQALLEQAELELVRVVSTQTAMNVIEVQEVCRQS
jgi:hypothetical protein